MCERGCCRPVSVCLSVRPSVRPSRWCTVSTRLKISSNFFLGWVAPSFYFLSPCANTQFQLEPALAGAQNTRGGNFFWRFSTEIAVYLWNGTIGPLLLWNVHRKSYALYQAPLYPHRTLWRYTNIVLLYYRMATVPWPWRTLTRFSRSRNFWSRISQSYYRTLIGNHT